MISGETLRNFRKDAGLSLADIGKACGLSRSTLSRFENGERDLSKDAYNRVLQAIEKFLTKKHKTLTLEQAKLKIMLEAITLWREKPTR